MFKVTRVSLWKYSVNSTPYTLKVLKIIQIEITGQTLTWKATNTVHSVHYLLTDW